MAKQACPNAHKVHHLNRGYVQHDADKLATAIRKEYKCGNDVLVIDAISDSDLATVAEVTVHAPLGTGPLFGRLIVHSAGPASRKHGPVPFRYAKGTVPNGTVEFVKMTYFAELWVN